MFKPGEIVKLKHRSAEYPFFVFVSDDWKVFHTESTILFSGTILVNHLKGKTKEPYRALAVGTHTNSWDVRKFELSSWEELKNWI